MLSGNGPASPPARIVESRTPRTDKIERRPRASRGVIVQGAEADPEP